MTIRVAQKPACVQPSCIARRQYLEKDARHSQRRSSYARIHMLYGRFNRQIFSCYKHYLRILWSFIQWSIYSSHRPFTILLQAPSHGIHLRFACAVWLLPFRINDSCEATLEVCSNFWIYYFHLAMHHLRFQRITSLWIFRVGSFAMSQRHCGKATFPAMNGDVVRC